MPVDPLSAERAAFLIASAATANAAQEFDRLTGDQPLSRDEAVAAWHAGRRLTEKQTDALAALDRFLQGGVEMGLGQDIVCDLRAGRAELAQSLGTNLSYVEWLGRLLEAPTGEASGVREAP